MLKIRRSSVLPLTWEYPSLGKTVFILRRSPDNLSLTMAWFGVVWFGVVCGVVYGVWDGNPWYHWCIVLWCGMARYGMIWCTIVWYSMIINKCIICGNVRYSSANTLCKWHFFSMCCSFCSGKIIELVRLSDGNIHEIDVFQQNSSNHHVGKT